MNKSINHSYEGMMQDISSAQFPNQFFFEGKNIRILATDTQSTKAITNEKGNSLVITVPVPVINYTTKVISYNLKTLSYTNTEINDNYLISPGVYKQSGTQLIVGHTTLRNNIVLLTTDNNGFDCIWKINDETYDITLLYIRDLGFKTTNPIQVLNNYENENIDKIYWVDSLHQLRFINVEHSIENQDLEELIDLNSNIINMVGEFNFTQPVITDVIGGGIHTSGMIQYAYNLYKINSSQTKISPVSELVSLDKDVSGGGAVNEIVSKTPVIKINVLDSDYTNIKLYYIKYTSYNEIPEIALIADRSIVDLTEFTYYDDGNIIQNLSLEEFLFLGSDIIIPKHINSKFNRLFLANYKEKNYNLNIDTRAYSYGNLFENPPDPTEIEIYNRTTGLTLNQGLIQNSNQINPPYNNSFTATENLNISFTTYDELEFIAEQPNFSYTIVFTKNGIPITQNVSLSIGDVLSVEILLFGEGSITGGSAGYNTITKIINEPVEDLFCARVYKDLNVVSNNITGTFFNIVNDADYDNPELIKHDSINLHYETFKFQKDGLTFGGEGKYLKYELIRSEVGINNFTNEDTKLKFFKDRELYRIGIQFYNSYGQTTLPNWIADFIVNTENGANLEGKYAGVKITLKPLFYTWLNTSFNFLDENGVYDPKLKPVGYKLLRAERTVLDRTILCQGLINGMMSNIKNGRRSSDPFSADAILYANTGNKLPSLMRRFDDYLCPQYKMASYDKLDRFETDIHPQLIPRFPPYRAGTEVKKSASSDYWFSETFQFNQLMQMFSPEILFNNIQNLSNNLELSVFGSLKNNENTFWGQKRRVETKEVLDECKIFNAISPYDVKAIIPGNTEQILGNSLELAQFGMFCVSSGRNNMSFFQTYRKYTTDFTSITPINYNFYGKPIVTEKGQGRTIYNNNPDLVFYNSLEPMTSDSDEDDRPLTSVNSWGCKNITFALNDTEIETSLRPSLENLHTSAGFNDDVCVLSEIKIPKNIIYVGNLYGGNSYESKKVTDYIEIGEYQLINNNIYACINPGDTFVSSFKFTKLVKTDTEVYNENSLQHSEIVEFIVETTVDLKNRNDLSVSNWDSRFQPQYDEYQKYNTVYSQDSNFIKRKDLNYNFKKISNFDTSVICTKLKSPGELIDNWTDIEVNNVLNLNGKHGPINCLHSYKDELYTLQDRGFAILSINPRVQISGNDGLALQLGTGNVLDRYQYISTETGTLNKWSVISSPSSMYYYDTLNKSFNVFTGQLDGLSDKKGLHTYFTNNSVLNSLRKDNPLLNEGVNSGYDYINNDLFMTFHQGNKSFTIAYNEAKGYFTSFYDYIPNRYISKGDYILTVNPTNTKVYKQYAGNYNQFFDVYYPSYVILNVNPEADKDCVFDNINFKSEVTLNNLDQFDKTLTGIRAYNDYQNSGLVPLIVGRNNNLRRKFRDWHALIPRDGRNRIRAPYIKLKLQFNNTSNYKLILHDIGVYYTVY